MGGLHEFMGWPHPIITDSGGYQVFDGPRVGSPRRSSGGGTSRVDGPLDRRGGGALPLIPRRFGAVHGAGDLDAGSGGAGLRHRTGLRRVHALPRGPRLHAPLARAHESLARPLHRLACRARTRRPAPVRHRPGRRLRGLRAESVERIAAAEVDGVAGGLARTRRRCGRSWAGRYAGCRRSGHDTPVGIGDVDDILHAVGAGIDLFDCATPTRLGRHGTALVPDPGALAARPAPGQPRQPRADRAGLPLSRLPRAHARLPPLPGPGARAHRRAARHPPQPHLHGGADARHPRCHRRRRAVAYSERVLAGRAPY